MAEQLGSGLQNRVHRCDSGSRLDFDEKGPSAASRVSLACATYLPVRLRARSRVPCIWTFLIEIEKIKIQPGWRNWQTHRT
jgi:hypothetical protein